MTDGLIFLLIGPSGSGKSGVGVLPGRIPRGKVTPHVSGGAGPQKSIDEGMGNGVPIGMAGQPRLSRNLHSAQNQGAGRIETV